MRFNYQEIGKYFAEPLPPVSELVETLTRCAWEVEAVIPSGDNNWDLEIKILPDRANDAKTPLGLAREISALFPRLKLKEPRPLLDQNSARAQIAFTFQHLNGLLGLDLSAKEIVDLLERVGVKVIENIALIPPERQDLNIKEDLADEVARLYGYDKIPTRTLSADLAVKHNSDFILTNQIRELMVKQGYTEIYGYTFVDRGELAVAKPLSSDKEYLRDNLSVGMKKAVEFNLERMVFDTDEIRLFEIGNVFTDGGEEIRVATGVGRKRPKLTIEVIEKKLEEFEISDNLVSLDSFINNDVHYRPVSIYPRIIRDIAIWVPENIQTEAVAKIIKKSAGELCVEEPILFDEFLKVGEKSLAFRLIFQSYTKTLSDNEINAQMGLIIEALEEQTGFKVRK